MIEVLTGNDRLSAPGSVIMQRSRGAAVMRTHITNDVTFLYRNRCGWEELAMSAKPFTTASKMRTQSSGNQILIYTGEIVYTAGYKIPRRIQI